MQGKLILLAGPSGSGKGSLYTYVKETYPQFVYPVSWTTRAPRVKESAKAYKHVTEEEFLSAQDRGLFLESDHHFQHYYGTPAQEIQEALAEGKIVFHELDARGVKQLLQKIPREQIKIIFVTAGTWEELVVRIQGREQIQADALESRRSRYEEEMQFSSEADALVHNKNGKLEEAKAELSKILESILV